MPKKRHYKGYSFYKRGESFFIRVKFQGKVYRESYHPPEGLTESKQYEYAEKEAIRFRDNVRAGFDSKMPTFDSYANYVIETKKAMKRARNTIMQYKYLLPRLTDEFGEDLLDRITPARLTKFYGKLATMETFEEPSAVVKDDSLKQYIKNNNITISSIHKKAGIAKNTVSLAINGKKVKWASAEKLCAAIHLEPEDFFYKIKASRPISNNTVHDTIKFLNTVFKQAVKERILDYNPVEASNIPKKEKHSINYYQPEEIIKIFNCLKNEELRWQVLISLLIVTGCRRGEIAGLRWQSILWEHNLLRIDHNVLYDNEAGIYSTDSTKNMDEKYVEVDPETMELLREYRNKFEEDMESLHLSADSYPAYCFYQYGNIEKPIHPSSINRHLETFSKKNDIRKINPHSLRHSLASALIADGVDEFSVARQLGHKQVSTTREIYTHQIKEHQAKVSSRIPEIYHRKNKEP